MTVGRLRAVGWSAVFLVGGFSLALALIVVFVRLAHPVGALSLAAVQTVAILLAFGLATWLVGGRALHYGAGDFGGAPAGRGLQGFGWGFAIGGLLAAIAMGAAVLAGYAEWRQDGGSPGSWLGTVLLTGMVLLPAALAEELAFRGVPLIALSRAFGRIPAMVVLSLLFGAAHLQNPDISPLAVANIAIAGIFLSFAFFAPGGLWTATGAHLGWNLALAALAAPVSGLPLPMPWLDYFPAGPSWLTGGPFGPEGGVLGALCLLSGAALTARRARKESWA